MTETFRVFSGWDRRQAEAAEVFAYSVRQHASMDVPVTFISSDNAPTSPAITIRSGRTAFSYARFMVPYACGYEGRAAFFDGCDMLCLGDVAELADLDMGGKPIAAVKHQAEPRLMRGGRARSWTSVMLMDCAQLQVLTPAFVEVVNDSTLMRLSFLKDDQLGDLPAGWNALIDPNICQRPGSSTVLKATTDALAEPVIPAGAKLVHWSHISDPDIGPWIDASGSTLWATWRTRWRGAAAA